MLSSTVPPLSDSPLRGARRNKFSELNCPPSQKRPEGKKNRALNGVPEHVYACGGRKAHTRNGPLVHQVPGPLRSGQRKNISELICPVFQQRPEQKTICTERSTRACQRLWWAEGSHQNGAPSP